MDVVPVADHGMAILVWLKACECQMLEVIQDAIDFARRRMVFWCPGHDGRCVPMHRTHRRNE